MRVGGAKGSEKGSADRRLHAVADRVATVHVARGHASHQMSSRWRGDARARTPDEQQVERW